MIIPKQAAILCGGLGTRLLPITKTIPKPMVLIDDRPFLLHLLEKLKESGIIDIVSHDRIFGRLYLQLLQRWP